MTPEEIAGPSFDRTYKRADGELIGESGWVTDTESFDDDYPTLVIEETWERTGVREFWHLPLIYYDCAHDDCDEDAVAWVMGDPEPVAVCPEHVEGRDDALDEIPARAALGETPEPRVGDANQEAGET